MALKEKISSLIAILKDTEIDEIEISSFWGAQKIRVSNKKEYNNNVVMPSSIVETKTNDSTISNKEIVESNEQVEEVKSLPNINTKSLKSPLVGTYYSSPKPDAPSFVKIGDKIEIGQTICIIEAMKIFNEIESDFSGTVVDILVENGTPVEFDQDLIIIK